MENTTEHEDKGEVGLYELGYHLVPTLSEDDVALRVGELQKGVAAHHGTIVTEAYPERMTLAYTMRKMVAGKWDTHNEAYFGWMRFEALPEEVMQWKKELDTNVALLRYLLIKTVPEDALPPMPFTKADDILERPAKAPSSSSAKVAPVSEEELDKQIEELVA